MKKIALLLVCLLTLTFQVYAQDDANRLANTKIVDALNVMPTSNVKQYNKMMNDIASTNKEGIDILISMLLKNDGSREKVEYALNGYSAFVATGEDNAANKQLLVDAINKTVEGLSAKLSGDEANDARENPSILSNKKFLERQLMVLGQKKVTVEEAPAKDVQTALSDIKSAVSAAKKQNNYETRGNLNAALADYIKAAGVEGGEKMILDAFKNDSRDYRMTAINAVNRYGSESDIKNIFAKIEPLFAKYSNDTKKDLLYWFTKYPKLANTDLITPLLKSSDNSLVNDAAWALTRIGKFRNITDIADLVASSDDQKVEIAENCLKSYKGSVTDAVADLEGLTSRGEVAVTNIIAAKKDHDKICRIYNNLKSSDSAIKTAAYAALAKVADKSDLQKLYTILGETDKDNIAAVQDGINSALASLPADKRFETINAQKNAAGKEKEGLYWPVVLKNADNLKLLSICDNLGTSDNTELRSLAFEAYMNSISGNLKGEQRLLMYRNAMDFAVTDAQKIKVLNAVAGTNSFLGIIFAGKYIDQPALQQAAAQAVRTLGTGTKMFNGPEVKALLQKAHDVITGGDAGYQKTEIEKRLGEINALGDEGFVSLFNGKDLTGWKGLLAGPYDNPLKRAQLSAKDLAKYQKEANDLMNQTWSVEDGNIIFSGKGQSLCTEKQYADFEMYVDWKLFEGKEPDAGIYLRGTPQVQIWDTSRVNVGAQVGSGGLYNNSKHPSKPLKVADNGVGQWNSFYIKMVGERVTVYLNGELVVDNIIMENYWDRSIPILMKEQIELQAHGSKVAYRDIYIHELPAVEPIKLSKEEEKEGFQLLFDGTNLHNWQGDVTNYVPEEGNIAVSNRSSGTGGNLYTKKQYQDFIFRFEFKLTEGANNGVGIRAEMGKDAAYYGMEIQVLDNYAEIYKTLQPYQYHGSVYGVIPTKDRNQIKVNDWNSEEIYVKGDYVRVTLNGVVITEGNIREAGANGTMDHRSHPGLFNKTGYIGFLGHGSTLWFRNVRIKELK